MWIMARLLGILLGAGAAGLAVYWAMKPGAAEAVGSPRAPSQPAPAPVPPPPEVVVTDWKDAIKDVAQQVKDHAAQTSLPRGTFPPLVERWRTEITRRAGDMSIDAILEWMRIESGGKLCAPGNATEFGLFQLSFPGDAKYGATLAGLKEICQRSKSHGDDIAWMSDHDLDVAVESGIRKIAAARDQVRQVFASTGVSWSENSFDFWSAVKQIHATPAVITELLPKIVHRDGHPPTSWRELHDRVMAFPVEQMGEGLRQLWNTPSQHGLRNRLEDTLRNASFVGLAFARGAPQNVA